MNVAGSIFVENTLNDIVLDTLLSDVVYKHEPFPKCTAFKTFRSIAAPNINLSSKLVNGIALDAFVTNNTEQTFHASKIHGNVTFNRLKVNGLFDSVNITDLDMNSIKLFGEQFTDAEFIFEKEGINVDVTQLEISETINTIDVTDFINIDENFELFGNIMIDALLTNECSVTGEIVSNTAAIINDWDVNDLVNSHLSKKTDQKVIAPVHIKTAVIRGPFKVDLVNGFDMKQAQTILLAQKTNEQMLNESLIAVQKVIVNGNVFFNELNGINLEDIKKNAIRLDIPNSIDLPLVFLDPVTVNGNMTVDHLNGANFDAFVADLVRKSDGNYVIKGKTIFRQNIEVLNDITAVTINEIPVKQILTKNFKGSIRNPVKIIGDVTVSKLSVLGELNGISHEKIDTYGFDDAGQNYVIHKNVFFNQSIYVGNFNLLGGYNDVGNVKQYLKNVVRIDRPAVITGTKTFMETLHFGNNIRILDYNGINVQNFLSNVVLVDQYEPVNIYSSVVFEDPVKFSHLQVNGDLIVNSIDNCSLSDWNSNAIRTDLPFTFDGAVIFDAGTFEAANLDTQFLNEIPIDQLLTLNTPQNFSETVRFEEIVSVVPITTNGMVNGYFLPNERLNTLMVSVCVSLHFRDDSLKNSFVRFSAFKS